MGRLVRVVGGGDAGRGRRRRRVRRGRRRLDVRRLHRRRVRRRRLRTENSSHSSKDVNHGTLNPNAGFVLSLFSGSHFLYAACQLTMAFFGICLRPSDAIFAVVESAAL